MKKLSTILILIFIISCNTPIKDKKITKIINKQDAIKLKSIYNYALEKGQSYQWLNDLCTNIGGRLSGSKEAEQAVNWGKIELEKLGLDSVWLQPVMVPHWVRGKKEIASITYKNNKINVPICALGGSVATAKNGITAEIIEVKSVQEVDSLGDKVKGKIVFYIDQCKPI